MKRATYIGDRDDLAGKKALLKPCIGGGVMAQFVGESPADDSQHGWEVFSAEEFMEAPEAQEGS